MFVEGFSSLSGILHGWKGDGPEAVQNPCENYAQNDAAIEVNSGIDCFGDLAAVEVNVNGAAPLTYELFNAADTTLIAPKLETINLLI